MNNFLKISLLSCLTLLFSSCKNEAPEGQSTESPKSEVEQLQDEVMLVHDAVMLFTFKMPPKWETLDSLSLKLSEPNQLKTVKMTSENLKTAYNEMYQWMDDYGKLSKRMKNATQDSAMHWLNLEKIRIEHIEKISKQSIEQADSVLNAIK